MNEGSKDAYYSRRLYWGRGNKTYLHIFVGEEIEEFIEKGDYIASYVQALNLLGVNVPERFALEYEKEKRGVMLSLQELLRKEAELRNKIEFVKKSAGTYNPFIRNEADAFFVTFGEREDLDNTTHQIKSKLEDALIMGLHREETTTEPGITIGPEYVLNMCEKYEVQIGSQR